MLDDGSDCLVFLLCSCSGDDMDDLPDRGIAYLLES
ncbi:hypothetical protein LCGC14_2001140 [marine sediment metagenome]|uniref:Uncharacterized protein n=1 Tax=marine sediment metagenome TaxID=412755 RepID=A0A0F9HGM9_9ZZZZ